MMRPVGNHIQASLLRAIAASAGLSIKDREKPTLIIEEIRSSDWASATFIGATHDFDIRIEGECDSVETAVERLLAALPEQEIPIAGHIVAEIAVTIRSQIIISSNMIAKLLTVNVLSIAD